MNKTLQQLHDILTIAIERGFGDVAIECRQSNYGSRITLAPAEPPEADVLVMLAVRDSLYIGPAIVTRSAGPWRHPAYPTSIENMTQWLHTRGLTFTVNFLLLPPDRTEITEAELEHCSLIVPMGEKWFLWEIAINANGAPVAIWVAPTK